MEIAVTGLRGGHSGMEIDKGRGNAIKMLNRVLMALDGIGARLARIDGGNKRNAIPREARALVFVPARQADRAKQIVGKWNATLSAEVASVEPDLAVAATTLKLRKGNVLKKKLQGAILRVVAALPHGVVKMSADIPGLVETSTNVAMIASKGRTVQLATSQRSSVASEIEEIAQTVRTILEMGGAEVEQGDGYPGWKPNMDSPILRTASRTYRQLFKKQPEVKAVHAGLECGIIGEKYPGIDMVSFGPTIEGVHSPDERIHLDTVPRFYGFLLGVLRNVN
jgi:dipeptidase D